MPSAATPAGDEELEGVTDIKEAAEVAEAAPMAGGKVDLATQNGWKLYEIDAFTSWK